MFAFYKGFQETKKKGGGGGEDKEIKKNIVTKRNKQNKNKHVFIVLRKNITQ